LSVLEPDETILTPVSSPAVSHDPVTSLVGRISGKLNRVIDGKSALAGGEDTTGVVLPWLGIAADGERSGLEGGVDGGLISGNGVDTGDGEGRGARRGHAVAVLGSVGVARLGILTTLLLDPSEGFTGITTAATIIIGVAVNDFLRTKVHDGLSGKQVGGFDGFGGREGPAGTALFLVLDGSGHSLCDPIDGTRRNLDVLGDRGVQGFSGFESEHGAELFRGPVSELGVSERGAGGGLVQFGNLVASKDKVAEAVGAFVVSIALVKE